MSALPVTLISLGCIFGGMLIGMYLRAVLPEHHLSDESRDAVKLGIGMIATLTALVLGLLIASAKGNFDTINNGLMQTSSRLILLDRVMAHYGPETRETRDLLRDSITSTIDRIWSKERTRRTELKVVDLKGGLESLQDKVQALSPKNEAQQALKLRALQVSGDIAEARWLITQQSRYSSLPMPFFVMLVSWLVIIFFSFGLLSPRNVTVIIVLLVCVLSVTGSLFLILELDHPYGGLIEISNAPLRNALLHMGQ